MIAYLVNEGLTRTIIIFIPMSQHFNQLSPIRQSTTKQKYIATLSGVALLASLGTAMSVHAATTDQTATDTTAATTDQMALPSPEDMQQRHQAEIDAIKNNDYDAWVQAVAPEDRFDQLRTVYTQQGEDGLKAMHHGKGMRFGGPSQAVRDALTAGDYAAWKTAITTDLTEHGATQDQIDDMVSQDRFEKMQQVETLLQSGDEEGAHALMDELRPADAPLMQ